MILYSNVGDVINVKGSLMEYYMEYYKSMCYYKILLLRICFGLNGIFGVDSCGLLILEVDK